MKSERYVFDVIMRYSGAGSIEDIGPIASTFGRQITILEQWLEDDVFRSDIERSVMAEGVQAFLMQAMATQFCALHNAKSFEERLSPYLEAWLR